MEGGLIVMHKMMMKTMMMKTMIMKTMIKMTESGICHPERSEGSGFLLAAAMNSLHAETQVPRSAGDDKTQDDGGKASHQSRKAGDHFKTGQLVRMCTLLFALGCSLAAFAQSKPASVTGKWQLSWEARIGTESGTMLLEQSDSKLTGNYQGHISAPKIEGTVDGNKVTLNLEFQRAHPFTIIFKGTLDGDKMSGKFEIKDYPNGYDAHGENVRPSNYSWNAVRLPEDTSSTRSRNPQ